MTIIILALSIGIPLALVIGSIIKKIDDDDGKPWEHDAFRGRWE